MVDRETAERIAKQQREAFAEYQVGVYGEDGKQKAQTFGLNWIAYSWHEQGRWIYRGYILTDTNITSPVSENPRMPVHNVLQFAAAVSNTWGQTTRPVASAPPINWHLRLHTDLRVIELDV